MVTSFKTRPQPNFVGFTPERLGHWRSTLVFWGAGAGIAVSLYLSSVPIFQKDVLRKIPFVAGYFVDNTPDSDKPF